MMFDLPLRLVVAYGLMALIVLAVAALAWWAGRNTHARRHAKARDRLAEHYRQRAEIALAAAPTGQDTP